VGNLKYHVDDKKNLRWIGRVKSRSRVDRWRPGDVKAVEVTVRVEEELYLKVWLGAPL